MSGSLRDRLMGRTPTPLTNATVRSGETSGGNGHGVNGNGAVRPNGTAAAQTYDLAGRIATIRNTQGTTAVSSYDYSYDKNGNLTGTQEDRTCPVSAITSPSGRCRTRRATCIARSFR